MFWSKIWLFVIAAVAAVAITVALLLPRPAQRARLSEERQRLVVACDVVNIQLKDSARVQVDVAGAFARQAAVVAALDEAGGADTIDAVRQKNVQELAADTIGDVDGTKPDFAILIDRRGRVVARSGIDEKEYGDTIAGRWLVDDALAGYLRDDIWFVDGKLYRVAASPVIKVGTYVGAVVIGNALNTEYARELMRPLGAEIAFYAGGENVAASSIIAMDRVVEQHAKLAARGDDISGDCRAEPPFASRAGKDAYSAVMSRLPGEAQAAGAFYTVFIERPKALGLAATLDNVRKDDLGIGNFPWLLVGLGFLLALGIGLALMVLEADRPVRRLGADAVRLAKAQIERLPEEQHRGRFGSIARSINIHVDKLAREARAARRDLDQLLGPGDGDGGLGSLDVGGALPPRSEAPRPPPPPSEFRFSEPLPVPELDLSTGPRAAAPGRGPAGPGASSPGFGGPASSGIRPAAPPLPGSRSPTPVPPAPPGAPPRPRPAAAPQPPQPQPQPQRPQMSSPHLSGPAINPALIMAAPGGLSGLHELLATDESVGAPPAAGSAEEEAAFRTVFDEFVELKKRCGEATAGLTFPKFADKLRKNRDDLMAKPGCVGVKFSVYVKDGKAALKATPVKSE